MKPRPTGSGAKVLIGKRESIAGNVSYAKGLWATVSTGSRVVCHIFWFSVLFSAISDGHWSGELPTGVEDDLTRCAT